ncbi:uncharacterized protein IL334_003311 [Kwoniella shivajii]|uniref:Uncharacterized protein n=1 Tax=Kwoniella shivajii TaxID=564305 RepID=A0ABZ1CX70_9TREE|nr:hypothetical protein IL334_003311 [Kwoniella shivajii]
MIPLDAPGPYNPFNSSPSTPYVPRDLDYYQHAFEELEEDDTHLVTDSNEERAISSLPTIIHQDPLPDQAERPIIRLPLRDRITFKTIPTEPRLDRWRSTPSLSFGSSTSSEQITHGPSRGWNRANSRIAPPEHLELGTDPKSTYRARNDDGNGHEEQKEIFELRMEVQVLKFKIRSMNEHADHLISSRSPSFVSQALARLCGVFSPSRLFHTAIHNLAFAVGSPNPNPWYTDSALLDESFSRSLRIVLAEYDAIETLSLAIQPNPKDAASITKYTPPDVLWVLVQTADEKLLDSLARTIQVNLDSCKSTQRGVILSLLYNKVEETRSTISEGWKSWSESVGLLFAQNRWVLHDNCGDITRVTWKEITWAMSSLTRKRKRDRENEDEEEIQHRNWGHKRKRWDQGLFALAHLNNRGHGRGGRRGQARKYGRVRLNSSDRGRRLGDSIFRGGLRWDR